MLFDALARSTSGAGSGCDVEQLWLTLDCRLDGRRLAQAWTQVARRHPMLSTAFRWEEGPPLQAEQADLEVPLTEFDWTGLDPQRVEKRRDALLQSDRAQGFDLRVAPLMRIALVATGADRCAVLWTVHHLVLDGRVMAPLILEAFELYEALERGTAARLPAPPPPYRAFVDWLAARDHAPGLRHFLEVLRGKSAPTPLPLAESLPQPAAGAQSGELIRFLDAQARLAVAALAERTHTTVGTVVYAAWALVLSRLTGESDVVFGSTRSGRRSALGGAAAETVGLMINTLPMRATLSEERTVAQLLAQLREQTVGGRDFVDTPLEDIQRSSAMPRGTALFQTIVMFDLRDLEAELRARSRAWNSRGASLHEQPSLPLALTAFDGAELKLRLLYDRSRYRPAVAERIVGYLQTALAQLSADPARPLAQLDILPATERETILRAWNDTALAFSEAVCLQQPFEARAEAQPQAPALECRGHHLTYGQLEARANQLAHALRARGARRGAHVGICLDRGLDLVVALLAVAKSGATYVPVDAEYPSDRVAFMLQDSGAKLVVTQVKHAGRFEGVEVLTVDGAAAAQLESLSTARPPLEAVSTDPCYVIFTSGSTGKPKGVVLTHRAVINTLEWVSRTFSVGPGDRLLFVTSPCFDLSVYDTFGVLGAGATVVIAGAELLSDPESLARAVVETRITLWDSAPAALQRLLPFFPSNAQRAPLRLAMLSGDWIPVSLPDALRERFPRAKLHSLGGATEAAIWSNGYPIGEVDPRWTSIPYGKPIQNARYHVLDAALRPVPIGVAGDLYIGGDCLAEGYLNRRELTRERFIADPFRGPRDRLYKTGDLARYFDDGNLEFLGRADFQVKVRGYRVELGEVEAALLTVPGIREAVCAAVADASGQRSLVAYLVMHSGAGVREAAVKTALARKLPDFMVPSHLVVLEAMPLSSNGKLDRKALPSPTARTAADSCVEPRTEHEWAMAEIWQSLLRKDQVGIRDNFFQLGGHSLLAVMMVSRVREAMGVEFPLALLLEHPTIEALVEALQMPELGTFASQRHVVTLRKGNRPPLVLFSGIGGFGFVFEGLSRALLDQPTHVVHAIGAQGETHGVEHSIEQMAEIYLPEVLAVCPASGPIFVGGYSFGVLVAYEIAHRLRQAGREVPLIVSFDGFAPGFPQRMPLVDRLVDHARTFVHADGAGKKHYLEARLRSLSARLRGEHDRFEANDVIASVAQADAQLGRRLKEVSNSLWRARNAYRPTYRVRADLLLVRSDVPERWVGSRMDDPLYGWGAWMEGALEQVTIAATHLTLFDPANRLLMAQAVLNAMNARLPQARV